MKVFIHTNLSDNERYMISLLSQAFSERNITIEQLIKNREHVLHGACAVIFLIVDNHDGNQSVFIDDVRSEMISASCLEIPIIVLVEHGLPSPRFKGQLWIPIWFNRNNIEPALAEVMKKINQPLSAPPTMDQIAWLCVGYEIRKILRLLAKDTK